MIDVARAAAVPLDIVELSEDDDVTGGVGVKLPVTEGEGETVLEFVGVEDDDGVIVLVGVCVREGVDVDDAVEVPVLVLVGVWLLVGVLVIDEVGDTLGEEDDEGVTDGVLGLDGVGADVVSVIVVSPLVSPN